MTFLIILSTIIQTFSVCLGTGASTLAVANFFAAIADGKIDDTERRMMGIVYTVLRVAMLLILISTILIIAPEYSAAGLSGLSVFSIGQISVLFILYTNALLMTHHLIPTTFGPAIQAGSWYTLCTLTALQVLNMTGFTLLEFFMGYITWIILAVSIVNGSMALMKASRDNVID